MSLDYRGYTILLLLLLFQFPFAHARIICCTWGYTCIIRV